MIWIELRCAILFLMDVPELQQFAVDSNSYPKYFQGTKLSNFVPWEDYLHVTRIHFVLSEISVPGVRYGTVWKKGTSLQPYCYLAPYCYLNSTPNYSRTRNFWNNWNLKKFIKYVIFYFVWIFLPAKNH